MVRVSGKPVTSAEEKNGAPMAGLSMAPPLILLRKLWAKGKNLSQEWLKAHLGESKRKLVGSVYPPFSKDVRNVSPSISDGVRNTMYILTYLKLLTQKCW